MATQLADVYNRALSMMREYVFIDMDDEEVYNTLSPFLLTAEADFGRICQSPLAEKDEEEYFSDLTNEEIDILALGIVCGWMTAYVADADKLQNALGTKDYTVFSPANMLSSVKSARDNFLLEFNGKKNLYSFIHGNLIREQVSR